MGQICRLVKTYKVGCQASYVSVNSLVVREAHLKVIKNILDVWVRYIEFLLVVLLCPGFLPPFW